ncbi:nucleotidyltransferase family protein [Azotobacter chroococcum]|uniref:nucleotidyltransferase family protein n=1 Tax=Azotobacter chroococcum TaxID=353 RepID=UPI00103FE3D7|nr:nucleotidyltransferase family protein [Azotobacter chroococcum]TBW09206.1 nucleotidyltransferase family protein [Azotobacter chroococcum]TBW32496.1 nucleotidyltransferase family protein [Azotobacter chroococcum]
MSGGICAVLLAAGQGSRYRAVAGAGEDKLLARCRGRDGSERAVLEHALLALRANLERVLLVTRPGNGGAIALGETHGCEVLILDSAGMGESIAAAVSHAEDCAGWLIALGDMPFILPSTVGRVLRALEEHPLVVPTWQGRYGHPVGFGRGCRAELAALDGDRGAKRLLREGRVHELAVEDRGVLRDVDTPAALGFTDALPE